MSRATTGTDPKRTQQQAERRDASSPRVQFEALVEVGSGATGGFEAESIDVSPDGIRLRTAYLPEIGERLVCRFDGFGGEVVTEGEVIWRQPQGRGGEFGLRFVGLDERGAKLLQEMCQPAGDGEHDAAVDPGAALVGARVKLHIDGLGSPMRARVKDTARGEVLVGSSLEFLRVGRDIELEDVEHGGRRLAMIEHVGVEIDRVNNVPQLVVALRYDDADKAAAIEEEAPSAERQPSRAAKFQGAPVDESIQKETTPEPTVIDHEEPADRPDHRVQAAADEEILEGEDLSGDQPPTLATPTHREPGEASDSEDRVAAAAAKVQATSQKLGGLAKALGPKLVAAGSSAKSALGSILEGVRKKRGEEAATKGGKGPKRMTAPPPSGALRSDGRKLFRQVRNSAADDVSDVEAPVKSDVSRKAVGAAIFGALLVLGGYVFVSQSGQKAPTAEPALAAQSLASTAEPASPDADVPVPGGAVATANVPLFGATPLSTTEPIPAPPSDAAAVVAASAEVPEEPPAPPAGLDAAVGDGEGSDAGAADGASGASAPGSAALRKSWGVGEVHDPVSLKLTMDGDVSGFSGSEGDSGFTLVIPGRKSVSSASGLARKDKRIESLNVVNYPDRAEVTVRFKDDVPAFAVKSSGNRVSIDIDGGKGKHGDDEEAGTSKKKAKVASKSGAHDKSEKLSAREKSEKADKSKSSDKSKKHDSKKAKSAVEASKSEKKSDKKAGKKAHK